MNKLASMGEGHTPVVESLSIGPRAGVRIFFKLEMCNPSGSYKDRFTAALLPDFRERGLGSCIATSSGNTGAALAAYSARYQIACSIFVNEFAPAAKLQQMQAHGARVFRVRGFITSPEVTARVYERLRTISDESGIPAVVSAYRYCPTGMQGVEKIANELVEQCPGEIEHVFVPVGGGGLFTAVSRGFRALEGRRPRVHAVQPEGCPTVVSAYVEGRHEILPVTSTTRISGLAVPFDIDASTALKELRCGDGTAIGVSDAEVYAAQKLMMRTEGIWAEPAGAAALAGCLRAKRQGLLGSDELVVCLVTGHGFKDPESLAEAVGENGSTLIDESEISPQLLEARV